MLCVELGAKYLEQLIDGGEFYKFCEENGKFAAALLQQVAHTRFKNECVIPHLRDSNSVYNLLLREHRENDVVGINISIIGRELGLERDAVIKAGDKLMNEGLIYCTVDDQSWAALKY